VYRLSVTDPRKLSGDGGAPVPGRAASTRRPVAGAPAAPRSGIALDLLFGRFGDAAPTMPR